MLQDGSDWPNRPCEWQRLDGKWCYCTYCASPLTWKPETFLFLFFFFLLLLFAIDVHHTNRNVIWQNLSGCWKRWVTQTDASLLMIIFKFSLYWHINQPCNLWKQQPVQHSEKNDCCCFSFFFFFLFVFFTLRRMSTNQSDGGTDKASCAGLCQPS